MTGEWPQGHIDHLDGDSLNHAWSNLRDVSNRLNGENRKKANSNNKSSGLLGVSRVKDGRYAALIRVDGRLQRLGVFVDPQQAHQAYLTAKRQLHAGCTI